MLGGITSSFLLRLPQGLSLALEGLEVVDNILLPLLLPASADELYAARLKKDFINTGIYIVHSDHFHPPPPHSFEIPFF